MHTRIRGTSGSLILLAVFAVTAPSVAQDGSAPIAADRSKGSADATVEATVATPGTTPERPNSTELGARSASASPVELLSLDDALSQSLKAQPSLDQARAQTEAAEGRVEQARSGYLPQVTATASYQRTTANFVPRPGTSANISSIPAATNTLYDFYNLSLTATQLIYDFGQTSGRWNAATSNAESQRTNERTVRNQVLGNVYVTYFQAAANRELARVAEESLSNLERHLFQIDAMVTVGVRPEIDRTQAKVDVANARTAVISARNNYAIAKAQLNQAMGRYRTTSYDVTDSELKPVEGEAQSVDQIVVTALSRRPELVSLERQRDAQQATLSSLRGGYGPSLSASATASDAGMKPDNLRYNWNVGVALTWPLLQGGLTQGQVREAAANLKATEAQLQTIRLQIRTQITQAKLAIAAGNESIASATEVVQNARQRLKLAEGRYTSGVGNIIELSDAQTAFSAAQAQLVQAKFNLAAARAQLLTALGIQ